MKKLTLLISVLIILLALTGLASASSIPEPINFSIQGNTTDLGELEQEGCKVEFKNLIAEGSVSGDLIGSFTYIEEGKAYICPTYPYGTNEGFMTIETDSGLLVIEFKGETGPSEVEDEWVVLGEWELKSASATGDYERLEGDGTYSGDARLFGFTVAFTGQFYTDSD